MYTRLLALLLVSCTMVATQSDAHFQTLIPSRDIITGPKSPVVKLLMRFTHPMEQGPLMNMGKPRRFGVLANGRHSDLKAALEAEREKDSTFYRASYRVKRPGDHIFYLEPAPYWEPAEGKMIVHYTKVVVDAFGAESGWDASVGFPVEIRPLARPYGLWTGNAFRGVVERDGKPVPFAEIEVEYWNAEGAVSVPTSPFVTQVIRADADGTFSYTMPRAGWWGFAALVEGASKMNNPEGKPVPVELGGLIWIRVQDMD